MLYMSHYVPVTARNCILDLERNMDEKQNWVVAR